MRSGRLIFPVAHAFTGATFFSTPVATCRYPWLTEWKKWTSRCGCTRAAHDSNEFLPARIPRHRFAAARKAPVTAGSIANLALLAYLRYPVSLWIVGLGQCVKRIFWLLRHRRLRGICKGVAMIPSHLSANRRYRMPLTHEAVRSYLALRRAPVPETF